MKRLPAKRASEADRLSAFDVLRGDPRLAKPCRCKSGSSRSSLVGLETPVDKLREDVHQHACTLWRQEPDATDDMIVVFRKHDVGRPRVIKGVALQAILTVDLPAQAFGENRVLRRSIASQVAMVCPLGVFDDNQLHQVSRGEASSRAETATWVQLQIC